MNRGALRTLQLAADRYRRGQYDDAIDALCTLLGGDPDVAEAHALLAHCLLRRKRLHAAEFEAGQALALAPDSMESLVAAAAVALAKRRLDQASELLERALGIDPMSDDVLDHMARLAIVRGKEAEAVALNREAQSLDPERPDHVALGAWLALRRGDRDQARAEALRALDMDAENVEALCVLGEAHLADGRVDEAREAAAWALDIDPMSEEALSLLAGIKARRSLALGLWWRFQSFIASGSRTRAIALLIALFVAYRAAAITLEIQGLERLSLPLSIAWFGFCAYTWIAPSIFWKAVSRELRQVRLRPGF